MSPSPTAPWMPCSESCTSSPPSFSLTSEHFLSGCSGGRERGDIRRLFSDLFSWTDGTAAPGRRALRLEEGGPVLAFSLEKIPKQGCTQAMVREHWEGIVGGWVTGHWEGIGRPQGICSHSQWRPGPYGCVQQPESRAGTRDIGR